MRLGVSPVATSTPTAVFNQRFETYFPALEPWVAWSVSLPHCSSQSIYVQMWGHRGHRDHLLHPPLPHWVCQPQPSCESCLPSCPSPPLLPVWMKVSSLTPWLSDFHIVQFSGSCGCFLFLNLLLSFWLCKEAQCIYLCLRLGQKSDLYFFNVATKKFYITCDHYLSEIYLTIYFCQIVLAWRSLCKLLHQ